MNLGVDQRYATSGTEAAVDKASTTRRLEIDRAKGFAIVLVVIGHLFNYGTETVPQWYIALSRLIYAFHMPFFMYLSGFVFVIGSAPGKTGASYGRYLRTRLDRLIVPFAVLGLVIVFGRYELSALYRMHDSVSSPLEGLWDVVANTTANPTLSVWYLLVLFVYCVITPPLFQLLRRRTVGLFVVALCLYLTPINDPLNLTHVVRFVAPVTDPFYLARIMHFYVYFCAGCVVGHHWNLLKPAFDKYWAVSLAVFLVILGSFVPSSTGLVDGAPLLATLPICGLASMPALHGLMLRRPFSQSDLLLFLGRNSMAIYLFNTMAIGFTKGLYFRTLPSDGAWFFLMFMVLLLAGVALPVAARQIIDRFRILTPVRRYVM